MRRPEHRCFSCEDCGTLVIYQPCQESILDGIAQRVPELCPKTAVVGSCWRWKEIVPFEGCQLAQDLPSTESHWGVEMNELASTLTGLADTFLSVPVVFVLLKSPDKLPSAKEMSAGDKPRWSEKRIVPQLWRRTHQPYIRMYAGLLSVITSSQPVPRDRLGSEAPA